MKNVILIAAIGGAVLLVLQKQAQAAAMNASAVRGNALNLLGGTKAQTPQVNVNGDMWSRLMGGGWQNLVTAQNSDGSPAFLKNVWGQVTTSDGKPVSGGDPIAAFMQASVGLPTTGTPDYLAMISPYDRYIDGGSEILGW